MKAVISSFESTTERFLKLISSALKISIGLGSACVIIYALRIGHFPQGLTLGDGLLFLLAACCFGAVYILFVVCLLSLGICLSFVTRPLFIFIVEFVHKKRMGHQKKMTPELVRFHWGSVPFALVALLLIWGFGRRDIVAYWNLPLLSIALYVFYSIAKAAGAKYRSHERLLNTIIELPEKETLRRSGGTEKEKDAYLVSLWMVMLTPLIVGGVSGQLIDGAMRLAQIRVENATIYIKAPYNTLMPNGLIARDVRTPENYIAYSRVTAQFRGFGNSTVIAFLDEKVKRQLDIPNDYIIVEKKPGE